MNHFPPSASREDPHAANPRRLLLAACLSATALATLATFPTQAAHAAPYPDRPLTLVVPQPPGGAADAVARPLAAALSQRLGQTVVVENRAGANGNLAAAHVARQPADGYTLFLGSMSTLTINPHLYKTPGFDALKDFQPLTLTNQAPNVLVVGAATPYKTVAELVAAARTKPGELAYGSAGNGNTMHLTGVLFENATGTQLSHVPYKGGPAALSDVLGGQIPMMFHNLNAVITQHRAGKVRVLALADDKRSPLLPEVPTMAEAGAKGVTWVTWTGLLLRAGTPAPVVDRLVRELHAILNSPEFRQPHEAVGTEVLSSTPAEFARRIQADHAAMGELIRKARISLE